MALDVVKGEVGVPIGLIEPAPEILHRSLADEVVVFQHAANALLVDLRREQFGQRRGDGLEQGFFQDEAHIRLGGKPGRREGARHRFHVLSSKTQRIGQHQPALDAPLLAAVTIVIEQPVHPFAPQLAVQHAAHQCRILTRHRRLVAIAIERPGLHLALVQLAAVQQLMKGVLVVVALGSDLADLGLELDGCYRLAHSSISMPSQAISQPAPSTSSRSGLSSRRAGLELFMWTKMRRFTSNALTAASDPCSPAIARWPMRWPVLPERPCTIISSSV